MLMTSGLTVGGIALVGNSFAPKDTSATNYTLTESKETLDISSVVHKSTDAIVSISTEGISTDMWAQNYVTKGAGSGVIIQSDGYIVTCYHVIDSANKITVTTTDSKTYEAEVVGTDENNDLAVIKIDAKNLHAVKYADSSKLQVGDRVVAIGNPLGQLSNTATTGIISALNRNLTIEGQKLNLLQTDASINPGNSGGALLDASGNLVGIVESKSAGSDVEGLGFAVPVNTVAKSVKEIIETGSVSEADQGKSDANSTNKAVIGIVVSELSDEQAMMYGYSQGGVLITSVTSEEAREAGLQQGDMLTSADGKEISTMEDLHDILSKFKVGDKLKLQVLRDGQTITLTTKLVQATN
jgi:serine protease Do